MVKLTTTRKARFQAALVLTGLTQGSWARLTGVHRVYLNNVLNGRIQSVTLTEKIDAFIEETESRRVVQSA